MNTVVQLLLPQPAFAATFPQILCGALPGCGGAAVNVITEVAIPEVARIILNVIAGLALIFMIVGGARWILSFGREEEHTKGFKTMAYALAGLILALTSHRIVTIIITEAYLAPGMTAFTVDPVFEIFRTAVRIMMLLLNTVFLLMIVLGGMRMVTARGKQEEVTKGKTTVHFAIFGAIAINVAPFIVKATMNIFF